MARRNLAIIVCCVIATMCFASIMKAATADLSPNGNVAGQLRSLTACDWSGPLGMINGDIADWQLSTSSTDWSRPCLERHARLYRSDGRSWCPKYKTPSEWLQIDLGVVAKITGLMTQGREDGDEWVTAYLLSYSIDAYNWKYITDSYGNKRIFDGNSDAFGVQSTYLNEPVLARFVRFYTFSWHNHPSLRVELIGCQPCKALLTQPTFAKLTASSELSTRRRGTCQADNGLLMTGKAWCAKINDVSQWLQFDIGPPSVVTGITTMGRGDSNKSQWVTRYRIAYSNDTDLWFYYSDASHLEPKEFGGNVNADIERSHFFNSPFVARYIRIYPLEWSNHISLRAGLFGCLYKGKCQGQFTRINAYAPCVENLSNDRALWVNSDRSTLKKRRHTTTAGWRRAHAKPLTSSPLYDDDVARDVKGGTTDVDEALNRCVTLTSGSVDRPTLRVDLRQNATVSGFVAVLVSSVVVTQPAHGLSENMTAPLVNRRRHITPTALQTNGSAIQPGGIERLDVYVDEDVRQVDGLTTASFCGSSPTGRTKLTGGSGQAQGVQMSKVPVHVRCSGLKHRGRYVYIEAVGTGRSRRQQQQHQAGRHHSHVTVTLCDITIY